MPDGIDTLVQPPKPAGSNPLRDPAVTESEVNQLRPRNHTPLPLGKPSQEG